MNITKNNQVEDLKTYIVQITYPDYLYVKVVATSEDNAVELVEQSPHLFSHPEVFFDDPVREIGNANSDAEVGVVKSSTYDREVS